MNNIGKKKMTYNKNINCVKKQIKNKKMIQNIIVMNYQIILLNYQVSLMISLLKWKNIINNK